MNPSCTAWLQVSAGTAHVKAIVKNPNGERILAGAVSAQSGCWSMLKGGMTAYSSGPGEVYFEVQLVNLHVGGISYMSFGTACIIDVGRSFI
jgi:hypothetical protein